MRSLIYVTFIVSVGANGQPMTNAKAESEGLMNAALPFAEQMLQQHGEFFPYGQALDVNGKVVAVAASNGREHPPSADLIKLLSRAFAEGATSGRYKATALVYDVRIQLPSTGAKSDAIAVALNHRDNYSAIVYFAYRLEGTKLVTGEVFAQPGAYDVFPRK